MKPKSSVWEYFQKSGELAQCSICKKYLKHNGNTTNLKKHLQRAHPVQLLEMQGKKDSSEEEVVIVGDTAASEVAETTASATTAACPRPTFSKRPRQLKLQSYQTPQISENQIEKIHKKLVKLITKDFQPLSIVENEGFREYTEALNAFYTIPSRKSLSSQMLPNLYNQSISHLKSMLSIVKNVAVTTDMWTSDSSASYITVTCHFMYSDELHTYALETNEVIGSHTALNIATVLTDIFNKWNVYEKVLTITTDNGPNIKSAITNYLQKEHLPCMAHTTNLIVKDAINSCVAFQRILKKCKALAGHFNHSAQASQKLKDIQQQMSFPVLKVKQDVPTRWNSSLIMIERFVKIQDSLSIAISSIPSAPDFLDGTEWMILKDTIPILKLFESLTTSLSGESYPTLSQVIPLITSLQHTLNGINPKTESGRSLKKALSEGTSRRFSNFLTNNIVAKASFLDPRFKKIGFDDESNVEAVKKELCAELTALIPRRQSIDSLATFLNDSTDKETEKPDIWAHFDTRVSSCQENMNPNTSSELCIQQYLDLPYTRRSDNPLEFWKKYKSSFPNLYQLIDKYLCVPATSVPSERIFSKTGEVTNKKRNRLSAKNLNMIIFLNSCNSY